MAGRLGVFLPQYKAIAVMQRQGFKRNVGNTAGIGIGARHGEYVPRNRDLCDGKIVAITGTIDDIGTNIYGQEYVTLNTGEKYSLTGVQCFFKNDQMDYVASLKKGDKITLYGVASIGSMTFKVAECRP